MDFEAFFNLYMRPGDRGRLDRNSVEFRYAAVALLIACANADLDEAPTESETIRELFQDTFGISDRAVARMFEFGHTAGDDEYLEQIAGMVNERFAERDKQLILEVLWRVAWADGVIAPGEQAFINLVATRLAMSEEDVESARRAAGPPPADH